MFSQRIAVVTRQLVTFSKWHPATRFSSTTSNPTPSRTSSPPVSSSPAIKNVTGLSENCLKVPNEAVGPGASTTSEYKVPEYFCYDKNSYFEAEIEILKYRLQQPSNKN